MKRYAICFCLACLALMAACRKDSKNLELEEGRSAAIPRFYIEEANSLAGRSTTLVKLPQSKTTFSVASDIFLSEFDVASVELVRVKLGLCLMFTFNETAARALYRESVSSNGKRIALFVNGNAIGARRFDGAISDGVLYTFVEVPEDELEDLVLDMKETISALRKQVHNQR